MIDKLGGRKYLYTLLITLLAFILVLVNKITAKEFMDFAILVGGVYTAGNVASKFSNNNK